ncbi:TetR/AcrR family transcriptional regulator [Sinosporangium siamense]|uniref:TetR family transcriptional regulator n=1 Tax=Sinosporangium siamense TaxID=1367973 RepID=A0A919VF18_9ACTN|nr:TetR family transcriptional regulator [Sinosporangium siamense]GII95689.1 TetR family transcriptional regulator [Sinosporangium siamense]
MTSGGGGDARAGSGTVPGADEGKPAGETPKRRPGRRPGLVDTRGEILTAAREVFAAKGFDKATIRGIAREAKVDPALVHHYFASKEGVFVAAMELPADPSQVVPLLLDGPREECGERLTRFVLTMVSDPERRSPVMALVRTAMTNERTAVMMREFMFEAVLGKVGAAFGVPPLRMEAAFSQLFGVVLVRHVLQLEPLASVDLEELVKLVAPTIQRYIDGT